MLACGTITPSPASEQTITELLDLTVADVDRLYGVQPDRRCRCYSDGDLYLELCPDEDDEKKRMWRVTVSATSLCKHPLVSGSSLPSATTPKRVRLGDSEEILFDREGHEYSRVTPADLRISRRGPLTADDLEELGDVEYQFTAPGQPVTSVFVRNGRVTGIAAWISESG
jgi:hypothetical protein